MSVSVRVGTGYDGPWSQIDVNKEQPVVVRTPVGEAQVALRIKDYTKGGPEPYFEHGSRNGQRFSIQFTIKFDQDVSGDKFVFGNDFDHPIRDILPTGFSLAYNAYRQFVDPAVEGDLYADRPYLYGSVPASVNYLVQQQDSQWSYPIQEEGADERRNRYAKDPEARQHVVYKKGEVWSFEWATPYLDLSERLAVTIPGFNFDIGKYANETSLRYVAKNEDQLLFAVVISTE